MRRMTRHLLSLLLSTILFFITDKFKHCCSSSTLACNDNCINSVVSDTIETKSKVNKNNSLSFSFVHLKSLVFCCSALSWLCWQFERGKIIWMRLENITALIFQPMNLPASCFVYRSAVRCCGGAIFIYNFNSNV